MAGGSGWKGKGEDGAAGFLVACFERATVGFRDAPANGETHAEAVRAGGVERLEDAVDLFWGNAGTMIHDPDLYVAVGMAGLDKDAAAFRCRVTHGACGVENEIVEELLDFDASEAGLWQWIR